MEEAIENQEMLLSVNDLSVNVEDASILKNISLTIKPGETHVLMGPNGAGKSTLGYALMGNPKYTITNGSILWNGEDITHISTDKRAKLGMFLSFQSPIEIPGISVEKFIRSAIFERTGKNVRIVPFSKHLQETMDLLGMDHSYAERDLNVGFSGGERKKTEVLQMLMLEPKLAILDETDSGLDVDAVHTVSKGIEEFQKRQNGGLLIITHNTKILECLKVDYTHVLVKGKVVTTGDATLIRQINEHGFEQFERNE